MTPVLLYGLLARIKPHQTREISKTLHVNCGPLGNGYCIARPERRVLIVLLCRGDTRDTAQ